MPRKARVEHTLTEAQELLLRAQTISDAGPGTVLKDFEMMRNFIARESLLAAGKSGTLPIAVLPQLNAMMSNPFNVNLERPQFRSFPNLQGVFLLLRATSMVVNRPSPDKRTQVQLTINPEIARSWDQLNPAERYFTLLEAWILMGDREMIGEGSPRPSVVFDVLSTWNAIKTEGTRISTNPNNRSRLLHDAYHTALLGLFGFAEIQQHPPAHRQGWTPRRISGTPLGEAIMKLIPARGENRFFAIFNTDRSARRGFGTWQQTFRPYFPEWKHNLTQLKPRRIEGVVVMKVSLGKVWRQFAVPPRATLDHLVTAIDDAFRFDSDHLYSVQVEQPNGSSVEYSHPFSELSPHASETRLERLPLHPGSKMTLVYDSGGQWTFGIVVERIDPPQPALKKPKLLAEFGKPPPQYGEEYEEDLEDEADQEEDGKDNDEPDEQESGE